MHVITPYAPGSFLKPVIIVSTVFHSRTKETAVQFVNALHVWHALDVSNCHDRACSDVMAPDVERHVRYTRWKIIRKHKTATAALKFHLQLTKDFINGGSEKEWENGWKPYLKLWAKYCPKKKEKAP